MTTQMIGVMVMVIGTSTLMTVGVLFVLELGSTTIIITVHSTSGIVAQRTRRGSPMLGCEGKFLVVIAAIVKRALLVQTTKQ